MSRTLLSLYALDRPKLVELAGELKQALLADDRARLATLLELGAAFADRLRQRPRAVDWFLLPEDHADAAPLFASLRRVAKKRALEHAWSSDQPSLEGRLRQHDVLRAEPDVAELVDKLLDPTRLPWFLRRATATAGWLDDARRDKLADRLLGLAPSLPPEIIAFARILADTRGAIVVHDGL